MLAASGAVAGCGTGGARGAPADPDADSATPAATAPTQARTQLAARAAAAKDRRLTASYTLSAPGRPDRNIAVVRATDGSWRVDIPGGALGGTADVSMVQNGGGLFQCTLPSVQFMVAASCVRVADPGGHLPARIDPRVQHPFTDWLDVLTDRQAALSVSTADPPASVRGSCFSVESNSASLVAPLDVGIYCYDDDGTLTGARLSFGTLVLAGAPSAAPASVALPGPVVVGEPLRMAAPPPSSSVTPTTAG